MDTAFRLFALKKGKKKTEENGEEEKNVIIGLARFA